MKKLFVFLVFFLILLLPASFAFNLWSGKKNLEKAKTFLLSGDFEKAEIAAANSSRCFKRVKVLKRISRIKDLIEIGEGFSKASFHLAKTGESIEKIINVVLGKETGDLKKIAGGARIELDLAWEDLSLVEGILKKRPIVEIPEMREKIEIGRELLSVIPDVFGATEKKSYLFLLQNNMELRATGGFIGSYALSIFENGKLLDFQVEDVYTADGQLKGYVEPPEPIKKYLGEAGWYLRDSNFDPDFPKTAEKVKWFFQKETGRVVDGVVAINLFVAQKILKAMGPVVLPDYQETITADNLFERAEYHSEVGFFPGSTQKGDFLANLTSQIFQKFSQTRNWLKIGKALFESLEEKQLLLSLNDERVMRIISRYNWDGRILENAQCPMPNAQCIPDYLMIVESNFGINKSNYFLERQLSHEIELGEEIEEKLTINYKNNSPTQTWPGGNYKNYLRVYTPLGSQLLEAKIDERVLDLGKVDISFALGKTIFGFLVKVPVGEEREVSVRYRIPFKITGTVASFERQRETSYAYSLLFQKQSGIDKDSLDVLISYPSSLKVTKVSPQALTGPQIILYNTDLSRDRVFLIEFTR